MTILPAFPSWREGRKAQVEANFKTPAGAPGLSLPVEECEDHPGQPSVGLGHYLPAHEPWAPLPGGSHGLAQPVRRVLAAVQHHQPAAFSYAIFTVIRRIFSGSPAFSRASAVAWQINANRMVRSRIFPHLHDAMALSSPRLCFRLRNIRSMLIRWLYRRFQAAVNRGSGPNAHRLVFGSVRT